MTEKEHFFWNKLLELAKEELTQATFDYYVLDTKLIKIQDNVATILLEEVKKLFWEKNMQSFILMTGFEVYNSEIKVEYVFDEALVSETKPTLANNDFSNKREQQTPDLPTLNSDLNSKYTFDNFIQGDENRWSVAASLAVADSPGATYNPLFIYGGPGLGKTHLLNAIGNKVLHDNPQARIKYITAENFINEFVLHIRLDKMDELKLKYRHLDVLLIDDIQSLAKKSTQATQEEFFNTFNVLHDNNKQIVLTSDRNPDQLNEMEEYFEEVRHSLIEDDELNRIRLDDDSREEEYVYFKDAESYFRGFSASLSKLYDFCFYHEEFEDPEIKKEEKDLKLEHLILSYPLYYIKQALYKEEAALELAAKYDEEQLKKAIKNYDKPEYQMIRKELREECCNPITYKVSFEMKVVGHEYNQNILKESVRRGMRYNDMDIIGDIKMGEED